MYTPEKLEIQVVLTKAAEWFLSEKLHKFDAMGVKVWFHDDTFKYFLTNKITSNPSKPLVKLTPSFIKSVHLKLRSTKMDRRFIDRTIVCQYDG